MGIKARDRKWKIRKEALGFYFIFVINFWMACYEMIARRSFKQRMFFEGYDLILPIVIGLPWVVIAIIQKNKWAWVRSILVVALAYAARALTVSVTYGTLARDIRMLVLRQFHKNIGFRLDWIVNVIYLILLTIVAFWIYKDELEIRNNKVNNSKPSQKKTVIKDNKKQPVKPEELKKPESRAGITSLDINSCSEADFMTLPGMSLITAKKAVENREKNGDYESFDDFVARNGIKPHFMVQMIDRIMVEKKEELKSTESIKRSRTLDL